MMREFRQLGIRVSTAQPRLSRNEYLQIALVGARHAARYVRHKEPRLASERRALLDDLDEYAELWLKQRDDENELYESVH
jgi:hypothetical protein